MADDDHAPLASLEVSQPMPTARAFIVKAPDGDGWIQVSITRIRPAKGHLQRVFSPSLHAPRNHEINAVLADLSSRRGL